MFKKKKLILLTFVIKNFMKKRGGILIITFLTSVATFMCSKKQFKQEGEYQNSKYIAYYFHPTARCEECLNLESFLKELIETRYKEKGFQFSSLNVEDKINEHFRNKFNLMFGSVVLFDINLENWKNLDSVWAYTHDKENFFRYTEREINSFINQNK